MIIFTYWAIAHKAFKYKHFQCSVSIGKGSRSYVGKAKSVLGDSIYTGFRIT